MKKLYLLFLFCLFTVLGFQKSYGQLIGTVTPSTNPLECNNLLVTVTGQFLCANASMGTTGSSVVGSTIFIDLDIIQPFICLPAIVPFSPQVINAGMIPAGTYTLTTRTFTNGILTQSASQSITIGSCCAANPNFTASATTICMGDSVDFTASQFGQSSYNWKINGASFSTDSVTSFTFATPGSYMVRLVTSLSGCTDSSSQTITVTDFPNLTFPQITGESCPGTMDGAIDLQVMGGTPNYTYSWSNNATSQDITGINGGTYQVWVTDNT
ncbi:MAG: hypothetical protein KDD99_24370, partial [Bacteroidetes bacterium]|nr:hypothetical protein [Bacteroidota bacterium]